MKNTLYILIILFFSVASTATEQVEKNLVQALLVNIKDFKELGSKGSIIKSISKENTPKGILYRIAVQRRNFSNSEGAVLSILETGTVNKTTGIRAYASRLDLVKDMSQINITGNVPGLDLIQGLLMQFNNFKQLASLGNTVTEIYVEEDIRGSLYRIKVAGKRLGVVSTGAVLSIQKRGLINKTTGLDVYQSEIEALEQKDFQLVSDLKNAKKKSNIISCAKLFK